MSTNSRRPGDRLPRHHVDVYVMRAAGLTLREIGRRLKITPERVRQIDILADDRIAAYARVLAARRWGPAYGNRPSGYRPVWARPLGVRPPKPL